MSIAASVVVVAAVAVVVSIQPRTPFAQSFGDLAQVLAALLATLACVRAAARGGASRRAWALLALATGMWATAATVYLIYGQVRDHVYPFPSLADVGFICYALPAAAALLCFPRRAGGLVSRLRAALDGLVIAVSILFVSWSLVLGPQFHAGGATLLARLDGLAFPIIDVVIASLVLVLGLLRPPGSRLTWALLGGGLVVLSATDSIYVSLTLRGQIGLTGTVLIAGWVAAFLLIVVATLAPEGAQIDPGRRQFTVTQELLPYVPVVAVLVEIARKDIASEPFLIVNAAVLLILVAVRQVLMFEKIALAGELEFEVAKRTGELAAERTMLQTVLESLDTAVVARDATGKLTLFNRASRELYGKSGPPESADRIMLFAADCDVDAGTPIQLEHTPMLRALAGEEVRDAEMIIVSDQGERRSVATNARPMIDASGAALGAVAAIHDITARKRIEVDLGIARNKALESSRVKSEFMATMSHEIRTPMNGVIGLTDLLLHTTLDATQRQYAEGVRGAGDALLGVMNDILDFSKLEAGKVELEAIDFDPRRLLEDVGDLFAETAQHKKLELVAYCLPDVPVRLRGDAGRIRQVLVNLTSNAVKFTAAGEVVIRARLTEEQGARVAIRFEVTDTGIGIAPGDRERLFEPFSQADASTTRRYGGTGLGLAICQRLAEAMGGRVDVTGEEGKGSTFGFTISLERARLDATSSSIEPVDALAGLRALVVGDGVTNQTVLVGQLTGWRMRAGVAGDGPMALRLMREAVIAGDPYRLAVLDMCMPDLDGLDLARLISADPALDGTELILLTSTMNVDAETALEAGVGAVLSKPAQQSDVYDRIVKLTAPRPSGVPPIVFRPMLAPRPAVHRGRVLVVEDNTINQLVAEAVVSRLGYQVDIVANGLLAVRAVTQTDYAAVLMDCHMPEMDGFEATAEIRRSDGDKRHLPIIAMTAGARAEDRDRCLAAGMDDYVSKPIDMAVLQSVLAQWVPSAQLPPQSEMPGEGRPVRRPLL